MNEENDALTPDQIRQRQFDDAQAESDRKRARREEKIDRDFPHYSEASRNAGKFLGLDYPYVPGDD